MAVKYECPKCGRRYVDWGAEKLGYKCPTCSGVTADDIIALIRVGAGAEMEAAVATLKRKPKKEVIAAPVEDDIDDVVDDEEADDEEVVDETEEVEEEAEVGVVVPSDEEEVVDEDAEEESSEEDPADLDFGSEKIEFDEGPVQEFDD